MKRGLSNIVSEAILISIVLSWMGVLATLPTSLQKGEREGPILIPIECRERAAVIRAVSPGTIQVIGNPSIKTFIVTPLGIQAINNTSMKVHKDSLIVVNTTAESLPKEIVFHSPEGFIFLDTQRCIILKKL